MDLYPIHADAQAQGNPKGSITEGHFTSETTYPGVRYKYWVHVPAQYDPDRPANLIVFLDGHDYLSNERDADAPTILDNLIAKGEIPVTIALFITPGDVMHSQLPDIFRWLWNGSEFTSINCEIQ